MSDLPGYAAALRAAVDEINLAKASGGRAKDSIEEAIRQLGVAGDGSSSEHLSNAMSLVAAAIIHQQDVIRALSVGGGAIETYLAEREL